MRYVPCVFRERWHVLAKPGTTTSQLVYHDSRYDDVASNSGSEGCRDKPLSISVDHVAQCSRALDNALSCAD